MPLSQLGLNVGVGCSFFLLGRNMSLARGFRVDCSQLKTGSSCVSDSTLELSKPGKLRQTPLSYSR